MGLLDFIPIVGDVVKGITNLIGTNKTNKTNKQIAQDTNQAQMDLARYQYEQNLEQWHRENAYNSPEQQIKRLSAAGLNPYLVYDNGNAIQASAASPQYEAPNLERYQVNRSGLNDIGDALGDMGRDYFDTRMRRELQAAQLENIRYQNTVADAKAKQIQAQTANEVVDRFIKGLDYKQKRSFAEHYDEYLYNQLANMSLSNQQTAAAIDETKARTALVQAQEDVQRTVSSLNDAQADLARRQIDKFGAEITHLMQLVQESKAHEALLVAQKLGQLINNQWSAKFGTNAPWWAKLTDGLINNPEQVAVKIGDFVSKVSTSTVSPVAKKIMRKAEKIGLSVFGKTQFSIPFRSMYYIGNLAPGRPGAVDGFRLR